MQSHSVAEHGCAPRPRWLPELDSRGLSLLALGIGLVGSAVELAATTFVPRLALYVLMLAVGAFGLIRRACDARRKNI